MKSIAASVLILAIVGFNIAGCAESREQVAVREDAIRAEQAARARRDAEIGETEKAKCLSYGLKVGTTAYAECRQRAEAERNANERAALAAQQKRDEFEYLRLQQKAQIEYLKTLSAQPPGAQPISSSTLCVNGAQIRAFSKMNGQWYRARVRGNRSADGTCPIVYQDACTSDSRGQTSCLVQDNVNDNQIRRY
jgi:hypothetical protein